MADSGGLWHSAIQRFTQRRGDEAVDDLGVPMRFHYTLLAVFAGTFGSFPLLFSLTPAGETMATPMMRLMCVGGVILAPVYIILPRRIGYRFDPLLFHGILAYSVIANFVAMLSVEGVAATAFQIYFVAGPIGAAFYFPLRQAMPHIVAGVAAVLIMSGQTGEHEALLRALILATIIVGGSLMVHFVRRRLVRNVELNKTLAACDPLTGTRNMRRFEERMAEEIARSGRGAGEFALIEFDLDNFKQVNDRYDHSFGDEVLIATADAIRSAFEAPDVLVRRGGDEFAVIAPAARNRDIDGMVLTARERVTHARRELCPDITPTVTSAAVVHRAGENQDELFRRADEALHDAKSSAPGRRGQDQYLPTGIAADRPTPETPELERQRERRIDNALLENDPIVGARRVIWKTAAGIIVAIATSVNVLALLDKTDLEFSTQSTLLSFTWCAIFAPVIYSMSWRRKQPEFLLHMLGIVAIVLVTFGCVISGASAPALAESYLLVALAITAILPPRAAFGYLAVMMALYSAVLIDNGQPFLEMRILNTTVVLVLVGSILSFTRGSTIRAADEMAQLARTDVLTGLPNTRRLTDRLTSEIKRCRTTGGSLAVLMLDLDNFKRVNDQYSHAVGDKVLIAVAGAITGTSRHIDIAARRGGDEFAVILPDSDARDATTARDRIAGTIASARRKICPDIAPEASIGWVVWRTGETAEELLARADGALHLERIARRRDTAPVGI